MFGGATPPAVAARFAAVSQRFIADGPAERADRARRQLLDAVAAHEPATLNQVAADVGRGAPAVSRSVDALVRAAIRPGRGSRCPRECRSTRTMNCS